MKRIAIGLLAAAGLFAGTSAFAADELVTPDSVPLLHHARVVCNTAGECWRSEPRRVIIDNGYGYYPRRFDSDRYYYDDAPSVGVYGPGFRFGFGPRPYW